MLDANFNVNVGCIRNARFQLANFKPILTEHFAGKSNFHAGVVVSISNRFFSPPRDICNKSDWRVGTMFGLSMFHSFNRY